MLEMYHIPKIADFIATFKYQIVCDKQRNRTFTTIKFR